MSIIFKLTEHQFSILTNVLETIIEKSIDYGEIREYISILDTLEDEYEKYNNENSKQLYEEIREQNFRQYLIDNEVIDKEILKQHYLEFLKQNENK